MCLDVDGLAGCCDLVVIFTLVVDQFVSLVAIIICRALVTVTNRYCWRGGNVSAALGGKWSDFLGVGRKNAS